MSALTWFAVALDALLDAEAKKRGGKAMIWIGPLGVLAWLAAFGSWGYQAYWWFQYRYWKPLPLAGLVPLVGLDWNLGFCLAVLGILLLIFEVFLSE